MRKTKKNIEDAIGVVFDQRDRIATLERELAEARKQADLLLWVNGNAGKQLQEFGDEVNSRGARIVDLQERLAMALEALTKIANGGVEDITAFCGLEPGDCALVCNWCGDASYPIEHADGCPVRIAEAALTATAEAVAQHTASVERRGAAKDDPRFSRIYEIVTRLLAEPPDGGTGELVEIATICEARAARAAELEGA